MFTGIGEITRAIQVAPGEPAEGSAGQGAAPSGALERMEVDEAPMPTAQPPPLPPSGEAEAGEAEPMDGQSQAIDEPRESGFGRWAPVSEGGSAEDAIKEKIKAKIRPPGEFARSCGEQECGFCWLGAAEDADIQGSEAAVA